MTLPCYGPAELFAWLAPENLRLASFSVSTVKKFVSLRHVGYCASKIRLDWILYLFKEKFIRILKRLTLIVGGTLVSVIALLWVLTLVPVIQRELAAWVSEAAGPEVGFGRIAPTIWPGPGLSVSNAYLDLDPSDPEHRTVTIASVSLVLSFSDLWDGDVVVNALSFSEADVLLEREADGSFPLEALIDQILARVGDDPEEPDGKGLPASDSSEPDGLDVVPEIKISNSSIRFIDHDKNGTRLDISLHDVDLDLGNSRPGLTTPLKLSMDVEGGGELEANGSITRSPEHLEIEVASFQVKLTGKNIPQRSTLAYVLPGEVSVKKEGVIDVNAELSGDLGGPIKGRGIVEIPAPDELTWLGVDWIGPLQFQTDFGFIDDGFSLSDSVLSTTAIRWNHVRGENLSVRFGLDKSVLRLADAKLSLYAGKVSLNGSVDFRKGTKVDLKTVISGVEITKLVESSSSVVPEVAFDTLDGQFEAMGSIESGDSWYEGLSGRGTILLQGGEMPSSSVIGSVGGALVNLIPGFLRPGTGTLSPITQIDHLSQAMKLEKGVLHVSDAKFVTDDYRLEGQGSIALDGALNLHTELTFSIEGMQKLFLSMAIPIPSGGIDLLPALPLYVTGTITLPVFVPEVTALPRIALRTVFSPILGVTRMVGGWFSGSSTEKEESDSKTSTPSP